MQAPNWDPTEGSGQVFLLDILSHRMSEMGIFRQVIRPSSRKGQTRRQDCKRPVSQQDCSTQG
jgi:hypothetical protein